MKQLFLMLFAIVCSNFAFAQSDYVITFDNIEESKNPELNGFSMTIEALDLGKFENISTIYYFGVVKEVSLFGETETTRSICQVMSFEGLEKVVHMDIYTVNPEFNTKYCKIKKANDEILGDHYEVKVSMVMRMTTMSLLEEPSEELFKYSEEETIFNFNNETDAKAFIAFMKG